MVKFRKGKLQWLRLASNSEALPDGVPSCEVHRMRVPRQGERRFFPLVSLYRGHVSVMRTAFSGPNGGEADSQCVRS